MKISKKIPTTGWFDTVCLNVCHALPHLLLGLFRRRKLITRVFSWLHIHPFNPSWGSTLRLKYNSDYIYSTVLFRPSLLVFNIDGIARVLDNSPSIYGEADTKIKGMSHWQPSSVTISEGHLWQQRRAFNEFVLATGKSIHPAAKTFLDAAHKVLNDVSPRNWSGFSRIHIVFAQHVVFGEENPQHAGSFSMLLELMSQANRLVGLKPNRYFSQLISITREAVEHAQDNSLTSRCPLAPQNVNTNPEYQVPHWMFSIANTLAENLIRVLWLISSYPDVEDKVRAELDGKNLMDPVSIDNMKYIEGCIQETMRLYPTTALIARKMNRYDVLGGEVIAAGTQIMIPCNFLHRDKKNVADADSFQPERWLNTQKNYRFNHFSNGAKNCPGQELVLFLGKSLIVAMMHRYRFTVKRPIISPDCLPPLSSNPFDITFTLIDNHI